MVSLCTIDVDGIRVGRLPRVSATVSATEGLLYAVAARKNGRVRKAMVAACGYDGRIVVVDEYGLMLLYDCLAQEYVVVQQLDLLPVTAVWSPTGTHVLVSGTRGELAYVRIVDGNTTIHMPADSGTPAPITQVSFHPAGVYFVSTSLDGCVVWEIVGSQIARVRALQGGWATQALLMGDEKLVLGLAKGVIMVWSWPELQAVATYRTPPPDSGVYSKSDIDFRHFTPSSDGNTLLASDTSGRVYLWDVSTPTQCHLDSVLTLPTAEYAMSGVVFVDDSAPVVGLHISTRLIGVLSSEGIVRIIRVSDGAVVCKLGASRVDGNARIDNFGQFGVSSDLTYLVGLRHSGTVCVYNINRLLTHHRAMLKTMDSTQPYTQTDPLYIARSAVQGNTHSVRHGDANSEPRPSSQPKLDNPTPSSSPPPIHLGPSAARNGAVLRLNLTTYGSFPAKSRASIWTYLLDLPLRESDWTRLTRMGTHAACKDLHLRYVFANSQDAKRLQTVVSALIHWSPELINSTASLFPLVYPLLHVFAESTLRVFETAVALLDNWCNGWLDYAPDPPHGTVLRAVEVILSEHDAELHVQFKRLHCSAVQWAWPMLQGVFAAILSAAQWAALWDCVLLERTPRLIYYVVVALVKSERRQLLSMRTAAEIESHCSRERQINVREIIRIAKLLCTRTKVSDCPSVLMGLAPTEFYPIPGPSDVSQPNANRTRLNLGYGALSRLPGRGVAEEDFNLDQIQDNLEGRPNYTVDNKGGLSVEGISERIQSQTEKLNWKHSQLARILDEKENINKDMEDNRRALSAKTHTLRKAQVQKEVKAMVTMLDVAGKAMDKEINKEVQGLETLLSQKTREAEDQEQHMLSEIAARESRLEVERVTFNEVWNRIKRENKEQISTELQMAADKFRALHEQAVSTTAAAERERVAKEKLMNEQLQRVMIQTHGNDLRRRVKTELQKHDLEQNARRSDMERRLRLLNIQENDLRDAALELLHTEEAERDAEVADDQTRAQAVDEHVRTMKNESVRLDEKAQRLTRQRQLKLEIRREQLRQMERQKGTRDFERNLQDVLKREREAIMREEGELARANKERH